jgi:hypothetical protein
MEAMVMRGTLSVLKTSDLLVRCASLISTGSRITDSNLPFLFKWELKVLEPTISANKSEVKTQA